MEEENNNNNNNSEYMQQMLDDNGNIVDDTKSQTNEKTETNKPRRSSGSSKKDKNKKNDDEYYELNINGFKLCFEVNEGDTQKLKEYEDEKGKKYPLDICNENSIQDISYKPTECQRNNEDVNQTYTRDNEVSKTLNGIGQKCLLNPTTTILEPTSGDGAFTAAILKRRLESLMPTKKDKNNISYNNFLLKSLEMLSTIYAVEYQEDSCMYQRCRLFGILCKNLTDFHIKYKKCYKKNIDKNKKLEKMWKTAAKKIIYNNIIWGKFTTNADDLNRNFIGYYRIDKMPIVFSNWTIKLNSNKTDFILSRDFVFRTTTTDPVHYGVLFMPNTSIYKRNGE